MQRGTLLPFTLATAMTLPVSSVFTWSLGLEPSGAFYTSLQSLMFSKRNMPDSINRCATAAGLSLPFPHTRLQMR